MSDDRTGPKDFDNTFRGKDPRTIDIDNPVERAYWLKILSVSEDQLRDVIGAVGPSVQKVKDFLKQPC